MKVALDTNVLISGLLFPGGPPDKIVQALLDGDIQNATSPDLLTELKSTLEKGKFNLGKEEIEEIIFRINRVSEIVYPAERLMIIKEDSPDNRVLECAVTAKAEIIVTGDKKHLLKLKSYEGIEIVSPADFILKVGII